MNNSLVKVHLWTKLFIIFTGTALTICAKVMERKKNRHIKHIKQTLIDNTTKELKIEKLDHDYKNIERLTLISVILLFTGSMITSVFHLYIFYYVDKKSHLL